MYIYSHADDFGMTPESCQRILDCRRNGVLNRVSVLPNGCADYAAQCLREDPLPAAVHINLVEGKALLGHDRVPLLADENGWFRYDFLSLLLHTFGPHRRAFRSQLAAEIRAQLHVIYDMLPPKTPIAVDSHQHTHMIPMVFHTLLQVIREEHLPVEYMRIPAEPLGPFLMQLPLFKTVRPVNLVKNLVLNFLWLFDRHAFRRSGLRTALFCGILFSGDMDRQRVMKVLPQFRALAERRGMDLEFLFHPGYILPEESPLDPGKAGFVAFYHSDGRHHEHDTLCSTEWRAAVNKINHADERLEGTAVI